VSEIVQFTDNIRDLSNQNGYQFEFVCERCGNGYRSPFISDKKEMGRGLLRSAGNLFGGKIREFSSAAESWQYDRATNSPAKDRAMRHAVEAVREQFHQCRGCGNWVCDPVCWNHEIGQCLNCSPSVVDELSRAQAAAQVEQINEKVREIDWTSDLDLANRAKVKCPECGAAVDGGKFCASCGAKISKKVFCTECGAEQDDGAKFCSECGARH
jgi:hypothetical protein